MNEDIKINIKVDKTQLDDLINRINNLSKSFKGIGRVRIEKDFKKELKSAIDPIEVAQRKLKNIQIEISKISAKKERATILGDVGSIQKYNVQLQRALEYAKSISKTIRSSKIIQKAQESLKQQPIIKQSLNNLNLADPSDKRLTGSLAQSKTIQKQTSGLWTKARENLSKITKTMVKFGGSTQKSDGSLKKLWGRIRNISIYRAIRTAIKWITSGFQEGLNNFVQYSEEGNKTVSNLNSQLKQLRNTMGVTLVSALQTLEPILTNVLNTVIQFIDQLNLAIAKSQGKDFYQSATKNVEDYAKSVKKAQKLSFDTFEVLSGGEQTSPLNMFEKKKIEGSETAISKFFGVVIENIRKISKSIAEIINKLQESGFFEKLLKIATKIVVAVTDIISKLLDSGALITILDVVEQLWDVLAWIIQAVANFVVTLNKMGALKPVLLGIAAAFVAIKVAALAAAIASAAAWMAEHPIIGSIALVAGTGLVATIAGLYSKAVNKNYGSISGYANGGIPAKSELFYMNENGVPEALMNTGGNQTNIINQQQLRTLVRDGYIEAMTALGMADGLKLRVDSSRVDDNAFARAIFPALKTESTRWGGDQL